ncbi:Carboxylesterase type B, partial [Trinorchestia longiramus]
MLVLVCCTYGEGVVVEVQGGAVLGARHTSVNGRPFYSFQAVPYAASPEADGRLKPPRPVERWHGVMLANSSGPYCAQAGRGILKGEEDCLHLSVY